MTKKLQKQLQNKKIYLAPYNNLTIGLKKKIEKKIPTCKILGFVDNYKTGDNIITPSKITKECNSILIFSPNYCYDIYNNLINYYHCNFLNIHNTFGKYTYNNFLKKRKIITFFGNCQARISGELFEIFTYKDFSEVRKYQNYGQIHTDEIIKSIKESDILVYQPLSEKYTKISFKNIKKLCKEYDTQLITFPYIYNNGYHGLEYNRHKYDITGSDTILNLYKNGLTKDEIIMKYINSAIDFNILEKFDKSLKMMEEKEKFTDIKLTEFIKKNYRRQRLFYGRNHPSNIVIFELLKQLRKILNLDFKIKDLPNLPRLCKVVAPISGYEKNVHKFEFDGEYRCEASYLGGVIIELIISQYENEKKSFRLNK